MGGYYLRRQGETNHSALNLLHYASKYKKPFLLLLLELF